MFERGGRFLHYRHRCAGDGRSTLVFSNSLGSDLRLWEACLPAFDNYDLLLWDKWGHGLSDRREAPITIDTIADDLVALVDALAIERLVPIGLSIGGLIAQALVERRPDRVDKLVLSNTGAKIGSTELWNDRIEAIARQGLAMLADSMMARWFGRPFLDRDPGGVAAARNMLARTDDASYAAHCHALRDADRTARLPKIAVPTLCLAGELDLATPVEAMRRMAESMPIARFEVLPGVAHLPPLEDPTTFGDRVLSFLQSESGVSES